MENIEIDTPPPPKKKKKKKNSKWKNKITIGAMQSIQKSYLN